MGSFELACESASSVSDDDKLRSACSPRRAFLDRSSFETAEAVFPEAGAYDYFAGASVRSK